MPLREAEAHCSHSSFSRRSFVGLRLQKLGGHRPPLQDAARMRWSGQIFWLLACGVRPRAHAHLLPAFTAACAGDWPWEVVSSYSSATAPECSRDFSRRSTDSNSQRTAGRLAVRALQLKRVIESRFTPRHPEAGEARRGISRASGADRCDEDSLHVARGILRRLRDSG